jgi:hypothetical protein
VPIGPGSNLSVLFVGTGKWVGVVHSSALPADDFTHSKHRSRFRGCLHQIGLGSSTGSQQLLIPVSLASDLSLLADSDMSLGGCEVGMHCDEP